jgi:hypothetical protein
VLLTGELAEFERNGRFGKRCGYGFFWAAIFGKLSKWTKRVFKLLKQNDLISGFVQMCIPRFQMVRRRAETGSLAGSEPGPPAT